MYLLIAISLFFAAHASALENPCNRNFVTINGAAIEVSATGTSDTQNIQCALDSAAEQGISQVILKQGNFVTGGLEAVDFVGRLSGVSRATTLLRIENQSVDCSAAEAAGQTPAAIKFIGGSPEVRSLSLEVDDICATSPLALPALIHFTGRATSSSDCEDNDVVFGVVDRVSLTAGDEQLVGVRSTAEGYALGGCKQTLLGTLKVNRSALNGFQLAIQTSMRGGAQVDVNYNEFSDNVFDTFFADSFQATNVIGNTFNGSPTSSSPTHYAVAIGTTIDSPPAQSAFVISENVFNLSPSAGLNSIGVYLEQSDQVADLTPILIKNTFNLSGEGAFGVYESGVNNGFVGNNRFTGQGAAAVALGLSTASPSSGWVVAANRGLGNFNGSTEDIVLERNASFAIIGDGQQVDVLDLGTSNSVLPIAGGDGVVTVPVQVSDTIISRISDSFDGWDGSTVVTLDNGQVWRQDDFTFDFALAFFPRVAIFTDPSCLSGKRLVFPDATNPPRGACVRRLA